MISSSCLPRLARAEEVVLGAGNFAVAPRRKALPYCFISGIPNRFSLQGLFKGYPNGVVLDIC